MGRRSAPAASAQSSWFLWCLAIAGILLTMALMSGCTDNSSSAPATTPPTTHPSMTKTPAPRPGPTNSAPTTKVPAPGGGDIDHTVKAASQTTRPPVDLSETAAIPRVLKASIERVADTKVKAQGPGEISGPGLAVSLRVTNTSHANLKLDSISLTMTDSDGKPCSYVPVSDSHPLTGTLAPGKSATGVYIFTIATNKRSPITIGLIYGPSTSVLLFTGTHR